jgi:hypothetical protein
VAWPRGKERKRTNHGVGADEMVVWSLACVVAAFYPEVWAPLGIASLSRGARSPGDPPRST